jgi:hypothetical protein
MNSRLPLGPGFCWDQLQEASIDHVDRGRELHMQIGSEKVFLRVAYEGPKHSASGIRRFYMYSSRTAAPLGSEITETGRHNRSHPDRPVSVDTFLLHSFPYNRSTAKRYIKYRYYW